MKELPKFLSAESVPDAPLNEERVPNPLLSVEMFEQFYTEHRNTLIRIAGRRIRDFRVSNVEPEDAVNTCMMLLWKYRHQYRGDSKLLTYATSILIRHLAFLRKEQKFQEQGEVNSGFNQNIREKRPRASTDLMDEVVGSYLEKMPNHYDAYNILIAYRRILLEGRITALQSKIVQLKRSGKAFGEIAEALGISRAKVYREYEHFRYVMISGLTYEHRQERDLEVEPMKIVKGDH